MKIELVIIKVLLICFEGIKGEPDWTYDILELDCTNNTPDILNVTYYLDRISRGIYAISGAFSIEQDLTDETTVVGDLYYSATGHAFIKTAFHIPVTVLSKATNTYYRNILLDSVRNCTENAPLTATDDLFVAPLTKRVIKVNKCFISNTDMPSTMRPGYYKGVYAFQKQVDSVITGVFKVEKK